MIPGETAFELRDGILIAQLSGDIDLQNAEAIQGEIMRQLSADEIAALVADLSGVTFLDSAGLRLLFALHRRLADVGKPMAVAVPTDAPIRRVLSIVDVGSVVWIGTSVDEAVERLLAGDGKNPPD